MNLGQLMEMHKAGALRVKDNGTEKITVGGMAITEQQAEVVAKAIGWTEGWLKPTELVAKTDRFMGGIRPYIKNEQIINQSNISMSNSRILDSEKTVDRYRINMPNVFDISIVTGMRGLGGKYGIFSAENSFTIPINSFSTLKAVAEFINTLGSRD